MQVPSGHTWGRRRRGRQQPETGQLPAAILQPSRFVSTRPQPTRVGLTSTVRSKIDPIRRPPTPCQGLLVRRLWVRIPRGPPSEREIGLRAGGAANGRAAPVDHCGRSPVTSGFQSAAAISQRPPPSVAEPAMRGHVDNPESSGVARVGGGPARRAATAHAVAVQPPPQQRSGASIPGMPSADRGLEAPSPLPSGHDRRAASGPGSRASR